MNDVILNGMPLRVDRYLCDPPRFIRWKRNHRKARINKKWHKKYGAVYAYCQGKGYQVGGQLVVCPCMKAQLVKEFAEVRR